MCNSKKITDLHYDALLSIMEYLPLSDVIAFTAAAVDGPHVNYAAEIHYARHYETFEICFRLTTVNASIARVDDGQPERVWARLKRRFVEKSCTDVVEQFRVILQRIGQHIRHLTIEYGEFNVRDMDGVFELIRAHCRHLTNIHFKGPYRCTAASLAKFKCPKMGQVNIRLVYKKKSNR